MSKLLLILVNMNRFTMSMRDLVRGAIPWTKLFWWNTALHQNLQTGLKGEKYNIYTRIVTKRYSCLLSIVTDTYSSKLIYTLKLDFRATKCMKNYNISHILYSKSRISWSLFLSVIQAYIVFLTCVSLKTNSIYRSLNIAPIYRLTPQSVCLDLVRIWSFLGYSSNAPVQQILW